MNRLNLSRTNTFYETDLLTFSPDINIFRRMMVYGLEDNKVANAFYRCTINIDYSSGAVWKGYKAMSLFLVACANRADNQFYFEEGKALLEMAISEDASNPDLRLIRFSVQHRLLKGESYYNESIKEDKLFLKSFLSKEVPNRNFDKEFHLLIKKFLQNNIVVQS